MRRNMRRRGMSRRRFLGTAGAGVAAAAYGAAGVASAYPDVDKEGVGGFMVNFDAEVNNPIVVSAEDPKTGLVVLTWLIDGNGNLLKGIQIDVPGMDALYEPQGLPATHSLMGAKNLEFAVWEHPTYGLLEGKEAVVAAWLADDLNAVTGYIGFGDNFDFQVQRVSGPGGMPGHLAVNARGTISDADPSYEGPLRLTVVAVGTAILVPGPALDMADYTTLTVRLH